MHAELARNLAITDETGQLRHCGITQARPIGTPARMAACRATVELAVPLAILRLLGEQCTDQNRDSHRRTPEPRYAATCKPATGPAS